MGEGAEECAHVGYGVVIGVGFGNGIEGEVLVRVLREFAELNLDADGFGVEDYNGGVGWETMQVMLERGNGLE